MSQGGKRPLGKIRLAAIDEDRTSGLVSHGRVLVGYLPPRPGSGFIFCHQHRSSSARDTPSILRKYKAHEVRGHSSPNVDRPAVIAFYRAFPPPSGLVGRIPRGRSLGLCDDVVVVVILVVVGGGVLVVADPTSSHLREAAADRRSSTSFDLAPSPRRRGPTSGQT